MSDLTRVCKYSCQNGLTPVFVYTCQNVQLMTSTFDTRLTRVKMHVANRLTRVQCRTCVKMHVAICSDFYSENTLTNRR
jgi:hypothetical protein